MAYLQLDFSKGALYEYSAEPKEGFKKNVSKTGKESYRKYYEQGASGTLDSVSVRDSNFGKVLSFALLAQDERFYINISILDSKGNIDTYTESLVKILSQLNKGDNLVIKPYNFIPEGEKYPRIGVSVSKNGVKLKGLTNSYYTKDGELVKGDIPPIKWKVNALGKNAPSASSLEVKNDFLLDVISKETDRLRSTYQAHDSASEPVSLNELESDGDLPF